MHECKRLDYKILFERLDGRHVRTHGRTILQRKYAAKILTVLNCLKLGINCELCEYREESEASMKVGNFLTGAW
jgi:hypothetical protein